MNLLSLLESGLAELGLELDADQKKRLLDFVELLAKWNKSYNLTAITDPQKMLYYHLLDSLAIFQQVKPGQVLLDVGSGAGLPGIPLAIAIPGSKWTLLDSNGKKTRFMQQALAMCGIDNARVVKSRVQDYDAPQPIDIIVSRAYASIGHYVTSVAHLCGVHTRLLTLKTGLDPAEKQTLDSNKYLIQETELQVPGIAEKRSLVSIRQRPHE